MRQYGLIGFPLSHSFSKGYFSSKFLKEGIKDCEYDNFPISDIQALQNLIRSNSSLVGLNVTIPYKEQVLQFLNEIDNDAKEIGAVNTLKITRKKEMISLKGYNTDAYGFKESLLSELKKVPESALILGTGGAAKAVEWVLKSLNIRYNFVSRNPRRTEDFTYEQLTEKVIYENKLIINTSPIGMYPNINQAPDIPYSAITSEHSLYDLIYNPEKTKFLEFGEQKKATTINGLPMLYFQAEKAWEIWNSD